MVSDSLAYNALKAVYGRSRPVWQDPIGELTSQVLPVGSLGRAPRRYAGVVHRARDDADQAWQPASTGVRRRRAAPRRRRSGPGAAGAALPDRRDRGVAGRRDDGALLARDLQPAAAQPRGVRRTADRVGAVRPSARRRRQPVEAGGRRAVPGDRRRDGRGGRAGRDPRGTTRRSRTRAPAWPRRRPSAAPTWCSSAAATGPSARSAPSSPARASRSGSSRPAPATCSPATWTSRSTSAPRSTSRSPDRTGPSTWSRCPATRWRTPTSW